MAKQKKFILQESEIPTQWYNIQADMPNKPMPPIHPATKQPLGVDDLAHIFPRECCVQELDTEHRWIDIPEDVLEKYKYYRSQAGRYHQRHHRDRRWSVGCRPLLRCQDLRPRLRRLSGEDHHAAEALSLQHHAYLRSRCHRLSIDVNPCR